MNLARSAGVILGIHLMAPAAAAQTRVDVVQVVSKPVERQVKLPGEFRPYLAVPIYAKVAGFVQRVNVDRGSAVRRGQLLATLEAPEMQAQIVEAAQALVRSYDDSIKAARAQAQAVRDLGQYLQIKAPFDGIITERNVHPGALVGPGADALPLFRLHQVSRLRLVVAVPETLVG